MGSFFKSKRSSADSTTTCYNTEGNSRLCANDWNWNTPAAETPSPMPATPPSDGLSPGDVSPTPSIQRVEDEISSTSGPRGFGGSVDQARSMADEIKILSVRLDELTRREEFD